MKLWAGRFKHEIDKKTNDFNSSISFDCRMVKEDIEGSIAHATMLGAQNIISPKESEKIIDGLSEILSDIQGGKLKIDMTAEDIHTFIEGELTARIGDSGKRLHTARSRNDQVALDLRMYLRSQIDEIAELIKDVISAIVKQAEENYRIMQNRYLNQLAILTDLLDANSVRLNAELQLTSARTRVIYTYYQLERACGRL